MGWVGMPPRQRWLNQAAEVLEPVRVTDAWGREQKGSINYAVKQAGLACAVFPASEKAIKQAQLLGVKVEKEVFLHQISLSPRERLRIGGVQYTIHDVKEWQGLTHVLVSAIS